MTLLLALAVAFLALTNGANDNFKGVASLYGSRTTSYGVALAWATLTTFLGSVTAIFLAETLLGRFSGKGLIPDALVGSPTFLLAVAMGAGSTVLLATLTGFPISTTHALTGGMLGAGLVAAGRSVQFASLGTSILLPLLLSPALATLFGAGLYVFLRALRLSLGINKEWCLCFGQERRVIAIPRPSSVWAIDLARPELSACAGSWSECHERYAGRFAGLRCQSLMDAGHFISAAVVSFARGLNDTPKIAALLLLLSGLGKPGSLLAVGLAMALGGVLGARRVAETMSHRLTGMNHGQGFSANLATGLLVIAASLGGLPVSTTHVSVGALFGIGLVTRQADVQIARNILLSWIVTIPCAAAMSAVIYWLAAR